MVCNGKNILYNMVTWMIWGHPKFYQISILQILRENSGDMHRDDHWDEGWLGHWLCLREILKETPQIYKSWCFLQICIQLRDWWREVAIIHSKVTPSAKY